MGEGGKPPKGRLRSKGWERNQQLAVTESKGREYFKKWGGVSRAKYSPKDKHTHTMYTCTQERLWDLPQSILEKKS